MTTCGSASSRIAVALACVLQVAKVLTDLFLLLTQPLGWHRTAATMRVERQSQLADIPAAQLALYRAAGVEPFATPSAGRGLRCAQRTGLAAGATLWEERPYAALLAVQRWMSHCQHCFSTLPKAAAGGSAAEQCYECRQVRYCSAACQSADRWHPNECQWLQQNCSDKPELTQARLLVARMARRRQQQQQQQQRRRHQQTSCPEYPTDGLLDHLYTDHQRFGEAVQRDIAAQLPAVRSLAGCPELDEQTLLGLFGRQFANACSMWTDEGRWDGSSLPPQSATGLGVWPGMALCNHSCEPNCWVRIGRGKKTALFEPFIYKMHDFTKTGSGQT